MAKNLEFLEKLKELERKEEEISLLKDFIYREEQENLRDMAFKYLNEARNLTQKLRSRHGWLRPVELEWIGKLFYSHEFEFDTNTGNVKIIHRIPSGNTYQTKTIIVKKAFFDGGMRDVLAYTRKVFYSELLKKLYEQSVTLQKQK